MAENKLTSAQQTVVTTCTVLGFCIGMGAMFALGITGIVWGALFGAGSAGIGAAIGQGIAMAMGPKKE